jgi:nucleoside-diphosphate-sugar epimerase
VNATLVTGASGFVGTALCAALRSHGWLVRGSALRLLEDPGGWRQSLNSIGCVVHLAAHVHQMQNTGVEEDYWRINVDGSRLLAEQAAEAGVRRFVFLSSVKVNGEGAEHPYTAADRPKPQDAYGRSKLEAEQVIREICAGSGMECVVIRPPLVYGPGVKANFRRLLRLVELGLPLPLASIENRRSLVGLANLVDFIEICMSHKRAPEQAWFVADDEVVSTPKLLRRIATHMNRPSRLMSFPPEWLPKLARLVNKRAEVSRLCESLQVDVSASKAALQWHAKNSLDDELARTVLAYRAGRPR